MSSSSSTESLRNSEIASASIQPSAGSSSTDRRTHTAAPESWYGRALSILASSEPVSRLKKIFGEGSGPSQLTEDEKLVQKLQREELEGLAKYLANEDARQNDDIIARLSQEQLPVHGLNYLRAYQEAPLAAAAAIPMPEQTNHISDERKQFSWIIYFAMKRIKKELESIYSKEDLDAPIDNPYFAILDRSILSTLDLVISKGKVLKILGNQQDLQLSPQENIMGEIYYSIQEIHPLLSKLSSDQRKTLETLLNHKDEPKDVPPQVKQVFDLIVTFREETIQPRIMNNAGRSKEDEVPFSEVFQ
jgi:hypothetical protein